MSRFRPAGLGDEHSLLADLVDELVEDRVGPAAVAVGDSPELLAELAEELGEGGLLAVAVPTDRGGSGADLRAAALVIAGLARGSATVATLAAVANGTASAFLAGEGPATASWQAGAADIAFADGGGDRLEVRPSGEGWLLNGAIDRVEAPIHPRSLLLSFGPPAEEVTVLLPSGRPGVEIGVPDRLTGLRGAGTRTVVLTDVRLDPDEVVGGAAAATAARQYRLFATACRAAGVSRAALDGAVAYMDERRQFGVRLADMAGLRAIAAAAAARLRTVEAAIWDLAGRPDALEPGGRGSCAEVSVECAEAAVAITTDALQLHGGYGYTDDFPAERLFRDALSLRASIGGTRAPLELVGAELLGPARV